MMKQTASNSIKKQDGLTFLSWVIVIVYLLFQAVIAMNVIPVYLDDATVKSVFKELPNDIKLRDATKNEVAKLVAKKMSVNNMYSINEKNIKVVKGQGKYIISVEYEPRGKLFGDLDFIVSFKHEATVLTR